MWKILRWILGLLLILILLVLGALWYLTGSENGTRLLLQQAQQYAPGELRWDSASGSLAGPLDLSNLRYTQDNGLDLELGDATLEWHPGQLLRKTVKLDQLRLSHVNLHLPEPSTEPEPEKDPNAPITLPDIRLPVAIEVDNIFIEDLNIYPYGATDPITIKEIKLAASGDNDKVQLLSLDFAMPGATANLSGKLSPVGNYPMDLTLDWDYQHPQFGNFNGQTHARGDLQKLDTEHQINGAATITATAALTTLLEQPGWDATINGSSSDLGVFSDALQGTPVTLDLRSNGNLEQFNAKGAIHSDLPQTDAITLKLDASGNLDTIHLQQAQLLLDEHPGQLNLSGDVQLQPLQLALDGNWKNLGWPVTQSQRDYELSQGTLRVNGDPENLVAQINTSIEGALTGPLKAAIDASRKGNAIDLQGLKLTQPDGNLALNASGRFDLDSQRFEATGDWANVQWPVTAGTAPIARSQQGRFSADGAVSDYRFELSADVAGSNIPKGQWQVNGAGNDQALTALKLHGDTLEGSLDAEGTAAWKPTPQWDLTLTGHGINPGVQWQAFPASLNLALNSRGSMTDDQLQLNASLERLDGSFRNKPLKGSGSVNLQGDQLQIDNLSLANGRNTLTANGSLAQNWDLQWKLNAPELAALAPELKGNIQSNGTLSGPRDAPQADLALNVTNLQAAGNTIGKLTGNAKIDVAGQKTSTLTLRGQDLIVSGQTWNTLTVDGDGTLASHQLRASMNGELAKLALALQGGLNGDTWRGELTDLAANKTAIGSWQLSDPATVVANAKQADIEQLCLESAPTSLCLKGNWQANGDSHATLTLDTLNPERFAEFLPAGMKFDTTVDGTVEATLPAGGKPQAEARLTLAAGALVLEGGEQPSRIAIEESQVAATLKNNNADLDARLNLGSMGSVLATAKVTDLTGAGTLNGEIKTDISDLAVISSIAPQVQAANGKLASNLTLGGTLAQPAISGELALNNFSAEIPQVNLKLKETSLTASSDGKGPLTLSGSTVSGGGKLIIDGELDPATGDMRIGLNGDNYQVANTNDLQARISPALQIIMNSHGMVVAGILKVPSAFVKASGGGEDSVTTLSSDVVIINTKGEEVGSLKGTNMTLNVRIELGDDVRVEAADFKGALKGNLTIEQTPQLAPRGFGTIEVVNGDYLIYGQQLNMERGRIQFSGGPVDNPRLDLDVAREVPAYEVTAGAQIRGTAQNPIIQLYSEPSMPDASVLSFILLGQPPGTKGGSFTLGKYLTPELYVSYGIGLFNAVNTFNLRYKLTDTLSLQARSGLASSADLIYTIER